MNKKAFTLVELLAVIAVIGILLIIATPKLLGEINNNKEQALENYKEMIVAAARNYVIDKNISLPVSISITQLCDEDYLSCPITNPVDDTTMSGYVNIDADKNYAYADSSIYTRTNINLNNVRYIKDCINGSTTNNFNLWLELQAIYNGVNIALGKTVTGTAPQYSENPYSRITDGDITSTNYAGTLTAGLQCITVDLTQTYNLDEIKVWHMVDGRTYYSNTTYVSSNNSAWTPVIANMNVESSQGKTVTAYDSNINIIPIYKVSNLITNGSLTSSNVTGWSTSASSINNTVSGTITSDGLYMNDPDTTTAFWSYYPISFISGHQYYFLLNSKLTSYSAGSLAMVIRNTSGVGSHWYYISNINSIYEKHSVYFTATSEDAQLQIGTSSTSIVTGYAKNVAVIDLTATFGAGNEPTQAWCDTNLNYFDGTQNMNLSL